MLKDRLIAELSPDATVRAREHAATATPHADAAVMAFVRAWFLSTAGVPADARVALCDEIPAGLTVVDIRVP